MTETKERIYQYGTCHKCGKPLSTQEIRKGIVMCSKCREKAFYEQQDNEGWF